MNPPYLSAIRQNTLKSIWSLKNVIDCVTEDMWGEMYCGTPLYKHVYHTLHSLDRWYINPNDYTEPSFHTDGLNDLNTPANKNLSREALGSYAEQVENKIISYLNALSEQALAEKPDGCAYTRFELALAQHRHLDMHIGMLMGFVIAKAGRWPMVLGLIDGLRERTQCEFD